MTSRKSSANKHAAAYDFKYALSSMAVPAVLSFIVAIYYFVFKIYTAFSVFDAAQNHAEKIANIRKNVALCLTSTGYDMLGYGGVTSIYTAIAAIVCGVLFAFCGYRFLMKKKSVNVFLSLGVDRRTLFKNRTIAGMLLMAASSIIPIIIDIAMNIHYLGDAGYVIYNGVFVFLEYYTYMLIGFSMMSITMVLCNTVIESLFFGAGFIWLPSILSAVASGLCNTFLRGYGSSTYLFTSYGETRSILNYTSIFNPVFFGKSLGDSRMSDNVFSFTYRGVKQPEYTDAYFGEFSHYGKENLPMEYIIPIIVWLAVCCVFIIVARSLFLKRKAENAELHGVKTSVNAFIALELSLGAFAIAAYGVYSISIANGVTGFNTILSVLLGCVAFFLAYFIIMSIAKRKIKLGGKVFAPAVVTAVTACVAVVILSTGCFGYSAKTPNISDVKYALISSYNIDATGSESTNFSRGTYIPSYRSFYSFNSFNMRTMGIFSDKEDLQKLTEVQKKLAEKTDNMTGNDVQVSYILKDGSVLKRYYKTTDETACYDTLSLTDTNAFENELTYLLSSKEKNNFSGGYSKAYPDVEAYDMLSYESEDSIKTVLSTGSAKLVSADGLVLNDIENTDALRDAILADRLELTYDKIYKPDEKPLGCIVFMDEEWYKLYDDTRPSFQVNESGYYDYTGTQTTLSYYIYPSTKNTIAYLKASGEYSMLKSDDSLEKYNITCADVQKVSDLRKGMIEVDGSAEQKVSFIFERATNGISIAGKEDGTVSLEYGFSNLEITDTNQLKALSDSSRIFGYAENDDYVVCFKNDDGTCYTSLIRADEAPDFIK